MLLPLWIKPPSGNMRAWFLLAMALVPAGLAQPLLEPPRASGGARKRQAARLPQSFVVVGTDRGQWTCHGVYTFDLVGTFGQGSTLEEHRQLEPLRLDPAGAVIWRVAQVRQFEQLQSLDIDQHCLNLRRLNIAKLTPAGRAWLFDIAGHGLPCQVAKIRVFRLPPRALHPAQGLQTLVTPATFCRSAGLPRPEQRLPGRGDAAIVVARPAAEHAQLEMANNAVALRRGFNEFQFKAPAIFLALRLQAKPRTQHHSCNQWIHAALHMVARPPRSIVV